MRRSYGLYFTTYRCALHDHYAALESLLLLWDPVEKRSGALVAPVQLSMLESDTEMIHQRWEAYKRLNMALASTAFSITSATDLVLMHDYHLMLLPAMLREKQPKVG